MARMFENLENAFEEMFDFITDLPSGLDGFESDFDLAFKELEELKSTLTQPNEGGKNKNVPTNEPLTLEELRLMVEPTPVWWDWIQGWVLARKGMIISWNGVYYNFEEVKGNFYRRPPEGKEETP